MVKPSYPHKVPLDAFGRDPIGRKSCEPADGWLTLRDFAGHGRSATACKHTIIIIIHYRVVALNPLVMNESLNISRFECLKSEDVMQACYFAQSSWTASSVLGKAKCRSEVAEQVCYSALFCRHKSELVTVSPRWRLIRVCCNLLGAGFPYEPIWDQGCLKGIP